MLASRTHAGNLSRRRLLYICPECQTRALFPVFRNSIRGKALSSPARTASPTRHFQTSGRRWASVESSQSLHHDPGAAIRKRLKAWSIENQKKKSQDVENASGDAHKLKRLAALPNSMFLEDTNSTSAKQDEDDAVGEDDALGLGGYDRFVADWNESHQPGDLFWWTPGPNTKFARPQLALNLGGTEWQSNYMLADGRWVVELSRKQNGPNIRKFASQQEVDEIRKHLPNKPLQVKNDYEMVLSYSFAGDIPQTLAQPLIARFAKLIDSMSTWRRDNLALLDSLYDRIADDEEYLSLPFDDVVTKLLGVEANQVTPAGLLTIFRTLQRKFVSLVVVHRQTYHPLPTVCITPKRLAKRFEHVCTWARQYQESAADTAMGKDVTATLEANPLSLFVAKARRLILKSRTTRSPTSLGSLGPSSIQDDYVDGELQRTDSDETFTENDRMMIEFLWDCYIRSPAPDSNRNLAIASLILRAIGAYPKLRLDANMGRLLLQELGTLPPWFQQADHDVGLDLPHGRASAEMKRVHAASEEFVGNMLAEQREIPGAGLILEPNRLGDSMASLRQDFGNIPVFCIDVDAANIREDGVSIEPNPQIPGSYWIHSHQPHPTAFIEPEHILAQRARLLTQGVYHHGRHVRMLPSRLCLGMSLSPGSAALTLSTLLAEDGQVLDVKLRPTTLRNVIYLSNTAVEELLGKPAYEMATMSIGAGAFSPQTGQSASLNDMHTARTHLPTIQILKRLLLARDACRKKEVAVAPDWLVVGSLASMAYVSAYGTRHHEDHLFSSKQIRGDPALRISVSRYATMNKVLDMAEHITITSMTTDLTSESAGKWFADRKLPAIFFGTTYTPDWPAERLNQLKSGERAQFPVPRLSSSPHEHVHKSQKAHLWISNPLRRYPDLMAHWNADCYLRAEADGSIEAGHSAEKLKLPFPVDACDSFITKEAPKMYSWALKGSRTERLHWTTQALFRAFHFKEIELPEVWDVQVTTMIAAKRHPEDSELRGVLLPWGIYAIILSSGQGWEKGTRRHSYLPVKLEQVDMVQLRVVVRVAGPPSDDYTQRGPLKLGAKEFSLSDPEAPQKFPLRNEGGQADTLDGPKMEMVYN